MEIRFWEIFQFHSFSCNSYLIQFNFRSSVPYRPTVSAMCLALCAHGLHYINWFLNTMASQRRVVNGLVMYHSNIGSHK